jgi:NAD(P) transhydrogenase subunit alpha
LIALAMKVGIPKEVHPEERRVAATPESVKKLAKLGFAVAIETGAGLAAGFSDADYEAAGAEIVEGAESLWQSADVVLKVRPPMEHPGLAKHELDLTKEGQTLVSFLWPAQNEALLTRMAAKNLTALAVDQIPRISRAQKMDALSSMANIAGYRAVVEAANRFGRFFTGQITAAGKVPPAKVMVIGAGVAGLAAIGAARGLGAIVRAFDTRPAVKEQVQSMGAEFLELDFQEEGEGAGGYAKVMSKEFIDAEMALFAAQAKEIDIIITTALIPGKKAPTLITEDMVKSMARGSVIVDLAAEQGGNCACTVPGEAVERHGVTIVGYTDLPSRMAAQSSTLYANNLCHLLHDMGGATEWRIDMQDEVVRGATATHDGEIKWPPPKPSSPPAPPPKVEPKTPKSLPPTRTTHAHGVEKRQDNDLSGPLTIVAAAVAMTGVGFYAPETFLAHLTVFVLACFIGWQVIWNVTPALHTPLMSVTNAISGIIIVGGMLHQQAGMETSIAGILGAVAILLATINISGGFLVTQRMLRMFRK